MTVSISLSATFPEAFAQELKNVLKERKGSWAMLDTSCLDMWQSMSVRRLAHCPDAYYILAGLGEKDFIAVQGNVLTLQSTVPYNQQMLWLLGQMLEQVATEYELDIEENENDPSSPL